MNGNFQASLNLRRVFSTHSVFECRHSRTEWTANAWFSLQLFINGRDYKVFQLRSKIPDKYNDYVSMHKHIQSTCDQQKILSIAQNIGLISFCEMPENVLSIVIFIRLVSHPGFGLPPPSTLKIQYPHHFATLKVHMNRVYIMVVLRSMNSLWHLKRAPNKRNTHIAGKFSRHFIFRRRALIHIK